MWSNVIPNGNNCVEMLRNLCPVSPSMYYVGVTKVWSWAGDRLQGSQEMAVEMGGSRHHTPSQLFLKEQLYQALESKRARAHHLAALTLQRYARTFFIMRRFRSLRRKIILLQSRARGYLARWGPRGGQWVGAARWQRVTGALLQAAVPAYAAHAHQVQVAGAHLREPPAVSQGEVETGTSWGGPGHPFPPSQAFSGGSGGETAAPPDHELP